MALKEKQFIEIDFTGIVKDTGEMFDTTDSKKAKAIGSENAKSLKICIGEGMLPKKFDEALVGKEIGKEYSIDLAPKDAFGERRADLVKMIPLRIFTDKNIMPYKGLMLNLDGMIVRIASVSGGRVITDFNNPLAGKNVIYTFKVLRVIEDKTELAKAFIEGFLKIDTSKLNVSVNGVKGVVELDTDEKTFGLYQEMFKSVSQNAKSLLGLEFELKNKKSSAAPQMLQQMLPQMPPQKPQGQRKRSPKLRSNSLEH